MFKLEVSCKDSNNNQSNWVCISYHKNYHDALNCGETIVNNSSGKFTARITKNINIKEGE